MTTEPDSDRPRPVTIIGRLLLVLAAVMVFKSLLDLVVWKVLQPAVPF